MSGRIERWAVLDREAARYESLHRERVVAEERAARYDRQWPGHAPHRVVRLVELRDGERVVAADVITREDITRVREACDAVACCHSEYCSSKYCDCAEWEQELERFADRLAALLSPEAA